MPNRVLHLIDPTTPSDALRMLALLVGHARENGAADGVHRVVGMGHRSTRAVAAEAGLGEENAGTGIRWVPSVGWADPAGWRGIRRLIAKFEPSHVHAWGIHGIVATALSRFAGTRIATFADVPSHGHLRLVRLADRRGCRGGKAGQPWIWTATSSSIVRTLISQGLGADRVRWVRPGIPAENSVTSTESAAKTLTALGIGGESLLERRPIILLGGEGDAARHDYGLWAAAILQQIFPRTRAIVREDPRGQPDRALARFIGALPADDMLVIAPPEISWRDLLGISDLLLATPDRPMPTGTLLAAMAAGVPVIGTPVPCVTELIEHGRTGFVAAAVKPRAIAASLEAFMRDAAAGSAIAARARAEVAGNFSVSAMMDAFGEIYRAENISAVAESAR